MFFSCKHRVQYYETDQMGVVHHSNYIRWFEEARGEYMRHIGLSYSDMEAAGVICPVVGVNVKFRRPARYDDEVTIKIRAIQYTSVRMLYEYEIYNRDSLLVTATTEHTVVDTDFRLMRLKDYNPEIHAVFVKIYEDGIKPEE